VVQARSGRGHDQPLPAPSVAFPAAGARYLDHTRKHLSRAHLEKNRSYIKGLVAHKGNAAGVRPQVAGTMENNNAIEAGLSRLKSRLASRLVFEHTHAIGGPIVFVAATASLVHFIANDGETVSRTSQSHMENKSQFSESLGTPHRAG
jgi:hypothetical protein